MDDMDLLIASFNSTAHVSQEAIDLAALQAELSSSLFQFGGAAPGPCPTTPTMSSMELSPSSSASASPPAMNHAQWGPSSATSSAQSTLHQAPSDWRSTRQPSQSVMDEEDMQMVEESLLFGGPSAHLHHQSQPYTTDNENSLASYAAMDPFFAAQLKASQAPATMSFGQASTFGFAQSKRTPSFATTRY